MQVKQTCTYFNYWHVHSVCVYNLHEYMWLHLGCVSGADEVNSRSVGMVLRRCKSQCEFHLVLQRAQDHLKRSLRIDGVPHTRGHDHTRDCRVRDVCLSDTVSKNTMKNRDGHTNKTNHRDVVRCKSLENCFCILTDSNLAFKLIC